jgi:molybdopterin-guanine dinucleotide biosynthesis protein A
MADASGRNRAWSAAVLAGGRATRLEGRVKAMLPVGGRPILTRLLDEIRHLDADVIVVARDAAPFAEFDVRVVKDRPEAEGAMGGLYTALVTASTPHVLVVAGDLPFVTAGFLRHLVSLRDGADVVAPRDESGWHPLCACYDRRLAADLAGRLAAGRLKLIDALEEWHVRAVMPDELARFDPDGGLLMNVNTPDEYLHACRLADARAAR